MMARSAAAILSYSTIGTRFFAPSYSAFERRSATGAMYTGRSSGGNPPSTRTV
jgi:hypothetical protein